MFSEIGAFSLFDKALLAIWLEANACEKEANISNRLLKNNYLVLVIGY